MFQRASRVGFALFPDGAIESSWGARPSRFSTLKMLEERGEGMEAPKAFVVFPLKIASVSRADRWKGRLRVRENWSERHDELGQGHRDFLCRFVEGQDEEGRTGVD